MKKCLYLVFIVIITLLFVSCKNVTSDKENLIDLFKAEYNNYYAETNFAGRDIKIVDISKLSFKKSKDTYLELGWTEEELSNMYEVTFDIPASQTEIEERYTFWHGGNFEIDIPDDAPTDAIQINLFMIAIPSSDGWDVRFIEYLC